MLLCHQLRFTDSVCVPHFPLMIFLPALRTAKRLAVIFREKLRLTHRAFPQLCHLHRLLWLEPFLFGTFLCSLCFHHGIVFDVVLPMVFFVSRFTALRRAIPASEFRYECLSAPLTDPLFMSLAFPLQPPRCEKAVFGAIQLRLAGGRIDLFADDALSILQNSASFPSARTASANSCLRA